ncbi:MAG TPA: PD-(D/E)XK nuclease family protein [Blastocatellia bacterium]|nr:PD-(D/E)XK nuclease family protein [Blastocatellia bacterium]
MNRVTIFTILFTALALLLMLAALMLTRAARLRRRSGLPEGEVVYEDASGLAREPLFSRRLGLTGKPDYLLRDPHGNLIPVEVKSGRAPRGGRPYESHRMQLAAYLCLVEDVLQRPAPYGLIRYQDQTLEVANTEELREQLGGLIARMRTLIERGEAHRSHDQAQRCSRCSMAHACDERLE